MADALASLRPSNPHRRPSSPQHAPACAAEIPLGSMTAITHEKNRLHKFFARL
jgi:hypothetical protein